MSASLKHIDSITRYAEFFIDSENDIEALPTMAASGKGSLAIIEPVAQGSTAFLTESDAAVYRLNGNGVWGIVNAKSHGTDMDDLISICNGTYTGADLTEKFADEIEICTDEWAWIKSRITAGDLSGINVGDYIEVTTGYMRSENTPFKFRAQIAGINTYKGYNGTVKNHIDFISERLFPLSHRYNMVDTNNGNASQIYHWLASDLYLWLNSLSGSVQSDFSGGMTEVDYTEEGVYCYLPEKLKDAISEKYLNLPIRYSENGALTDDNTFGMTSMGKLWLPDEVEVYGMSVLGGKTFATLSNAVQYPLFAGNMRRIKSAGNSGTNTYAWWLSTASTKDARQWCYVAAKGAASGGKATDTHYVPVCFRVMA